MSKNFFGMEAHRTDEFIHWGEKTPSKVAHKLRNCYDKIINMGLKNELEVLLDAAYYMGKIDECELNDPDL